MTLGSQAELYHGNRSNRNAQHSAPQRQSTLRHPRHAKKRSGFSTSHATSGSDFEQPCRSPTVTINVQYSWQRILFTTRKRSTLKSVFTSSASVSPTTRWTSGRWICKITSLTTWQSCFSLPVSPTSLDRWELGLCVEFPQADSPWSDLYHIHCTFLYPFFLRGSPHLGQ
jgi:hypothetical protein